MILPQVIFILQVLWICINLYKMDIESIKTKLKAGIYIILTIIVGVIVVRILLKLLGANEESQFAVFWYDLSQYFVGPFKNIYPSVEPSSSKLVFETYSVVAVLVYALLTGIFAKSLTSIGSSSNIKKVKEILDLFFKISEFFLGFRFILKITGANETASFVQFINSASAIVYEPFAGLLPTRVFGADGQFVLEISTLIALVVIIIFDVLSDVLISTLNKAPISGASNPKVPETMNAHTNNSIPTYTPSPSLPQQTSNNYNPATQPMNSSVVPPYTPIQQPTNNPYNSSQPTQNFNFNIGQPQGSDQTQQPQGYVDQRSVNVYPVSDSNLPTEQIQPPLNSGQFEDFKRPSLPGSSSLQPTDPQPSPPQA